MNKYIIEWSVKGVSKWQFWGGKYDKNIANSVLVLLNNPRFDYRMVEAQ